MQAVTQAYSSQIPSQRSNTLVSSGINTPGASGAASNSSAAAPQSTNDPVSLSPRGKELSRQTGSATNTPRDPQQKSDTAAKDSDSSGLSQEEQKIQLDLQRRDTEVRTHEQAHLSAAGQYAAGGASFTYVTGPGGKKYASGGEVPIDMSKEKTPEATIAKMRTVRRAALAPANPSGADRGIAAQASSVEAQAMKDILEATKTVAPKDGSIEQDDAKDDTSQNISPRQENSRKSSETLQVSTFSHKTMSSAYENIAALAA